MRLASFEHHGVRSYGLIDGARIYDVGAKLAPALPSLRSVLAANALPQIAAARAGGVPSYQLGEITFLPVIPDPSKILCVGLNYVSHRTETKRPESAYPSIFARFADTQVGHGAQVLRPTFSTAFDYEGELAVVIGRGGRHIAKAAVAEHIAGYACYNDVSVRDWQRHTHQWLPGKNFPCTGSFGPALVTPDEIPNLGDCVLTTRLNGEVMQQAPIRDLIFTIPVIIAYVSKFTPLNPGDVIVTGTPGGVGDRRDPPVYMKDGDVIEVDIDHIGTLRNVVATDASAT